MLTEETKRGIINELSLRATARSSLKIKQPSEIKSSALHFCEATEQFINDEELDKRFVKYLRRV